MSINLGNLIQNIPTDWKIILSSLEIESIENKLKKDLEKNINILPEDKFIFNCFNFFNVSDLKVVLIGMDPFIHPGEAIGLSFSVPEGTKIPPSLRNIFKEIERSVGKVRKNTDLSDWAKQGILMLNRSLTVREGISGSHISLWCDFTEEIIKYISKNCKNIVYILWGNHAKECKRYLDSDQNLILEWSHPSPLSRKPFTPNHFVICNQYLRKVEKEEIIWI
jgi:uracil-DNA glycosylase